MARAELLTRPVDDRRHLRHRVHERRTQPPSAFHGRAQIHGRVAEREHAVPELAQRVHPLEPRQDVLVPAQHAVQRHDHHG